jgi:hypothetical protein
MVVICSHGKVPFSTQREALRAISGMRSRGDAGKQAFAYLCGECGAWHQTSQSPKERRQRRVRAGLAFGQKTVVRARDAHRWNEDAEDVSDGEGYRR